MPTEPFQIELSLGIMFPSVNCYVLPGEQLTLVDCGLYSEDNWNFFQKKINELGYQVADIEQVILTHEHQDHIGLLPEIIAHSDAVIRAPRAIEKWLTHPEEMMERQRKFLLPKFQTFGFPSKILEQVEQYFDIVGTTRKIEATDRLQFFEEGDQLRMGDTDWEVLNTPGHCLSQFVFLQKKEKRIFSGDMLLPIAPMPIIEADPQNPGQSNRALKALLNSFKRLRAFEIQKIYPGHGPIFSDANAVIDKQLARIKMRQQECFEAIQNGASTIYAINRKMYPYQMTPPDFSGMYMVLGYVDLLEAEGRIEKSFDEVGRLIFSVDKKYSNQ